MLKEVVEVVEEVGEVEVLVLSLSTWETSTPVEQLDSVVAAC